MRFLQKELLYIKKLQMLKRSVKEAISSSKPSQTITTVHNRYEIKNIYLGEGSFGEVCACWDRSTSEVLAVKTISKAKLLERINKSKSKERAKEFYVKCLRDEALILQKLNHPNIIRFNGYAQTKSHLYFFLEYCNQGSLETRIKREGPLNHEIAIPIMRQMISAVNYLHKQKICHRDIKPQNILLHNGQAKLIDFGFAISLTESDKNSDYIVGTQEFIAPQALMESRFTPKSDVWSLGVTFFRMLVGGSPWVFCGDQKEWLRRLKITPAVMCSAPLWVKTVIGKMLTFSDLLRPSLEDIQHFFQQ